MNMKQEINDFEVKIKDGRWISVNGVAEVTTDCDCDGRDSHYCVNDATVKDAIIISSKGGEDISNLNEQEIDKIRDELEEALIEEAYSNSDATE